MLTDNVFHADDVTVLNLELDVIIVISICSVVTFVTATALFTVVLARAANAQLYLTWTSITDYRRARTVGAVVRESCNIVLLVMR